jgi:hypothetical protein
VTNRGKQVSKEGKKMGETPVDLSKLSKDDIRRELARRESVAWAAQDVEVTILTPCRDAWKFLARSLYYLEGGAQSLPMAWHTANQGSTDMTKMVLEALGKEVPSIKEYKFIGDIKDHGDLMRNMCHVRNALADSVETEYALFVDADVCLPIGAARTMLDEMKRDPMLGILGIQYLPETTHVKAGCMMCRTSLLKQFKWYVDGCECNWMNKEAIRLGYRVEHLKGWVARNLKMEQGG